ncbi:hypothetical protein, unlikely [Trypanosoma brucei gambiense DAL972]|uniref:Uncharacterized protein n=1 Tax=Trypanosoma brucei gambiense (strain MHOM/CI/86/DAL972) TaxID=679716 RepID=D0A252_TRYB9|nr:hypothetical protein, unlikely [Trypanosoma brucei gambiense DAL972]CBH15346.1 hypothetical protein, unlikely [Trypanosoma brucei gambiense DAL972]|eukprot:XP_011777610.1 hypothetical protein, unlikely [Trypanosoma brucei gambiense DAL972]
MPTNDAPEYTIYAERYSLISPSINKTNKTHTKKNSIVLISFFKKKEIRRANLCGNTHSRGEERRWEYIYIYIYIYICEFKVVYYYYYYYHHHHFICAFRNFQRNV